MQRLPPDQWTAWKRKRRHTLIGFIIVGTAVGIDASVIMSTLFFYLRDVVKTDKPQMWYGLIVAFFYLSSTVFGAYCGRWLDRTRKVRVYVIASLLVQVIGFILYLLPYHPIILVVARTICGIGEPFNSVVSGELFRLYDQKGRTTAMLWLASVFSFGFVIGPSLNFLFIGIKFNIGSLRINHLNFIGIFMVIVLFVVLVIANFLVYNCSLEFDLKEYIEQKTNNKIQSLNDSTTYQQTGISESTGESINTGPTVICNGVNNSPIVSKNNSICVNASQSYDNTLTEPPPPPPPKNHVVLSSNHVNSIDNTGYDADIGVEGSNDDDNISDVEIDGDDCQNNILVVDTVAASENTNGELVSTDENINVLKKHDTNEKEQEGCQIPQDDSKVPKDDFKVPKDDYFKAENGKIGSVSATIVSEKVFTLSPATDNNNIRSRSTTTTSKEKSVPIKVVLKVLLTNEDTLLIFIATVVFMYSIFAADTFIPLLVSITLKWSLQELSLVYVGFGVFDFFFLCLMGKICKTNKSIYVMSIVAIISQIITCATLICLHLVPRDKIRDILLVIIFLLSTTIGWCFDDILVRVVFANMVPSKIQSFSETLRSGASRIAIIAGSFTVGVMLPWVHWWSTGIIVVNCLILFAFLARWRTLMNPTEIPFEENQRQESHIT